MFNLAQLHGGTSAILIVLALRGRENVPVAARKGVAMSTAIIVAIVAFVSTILGACIGACTNYILAVRRELADTAKDGRVHAVEVKRAAQSPRTYRILPGLRSSRLFRR
jgi:hypothetical protein